MTTDTAYTYTCLNCGQSVRRPGTNPPADCPKCGARKWTCTIEIAEEVATPIDELDMTATNTTGKIVAERIAKADRNTSANLAVDAGSPSELVIDRKRRIDGFAEEGQAVLELAHAYNKVRGSLYGVEAKSQEDSDYADRVLVSLGGHPPRINVQVRNLDTEIIGDIGKRGHFKGYRTLDDLIASVRTAISDKAMVDAGSKAQTILLLSIPAALGQAFRRDIQKEPFDFKGFMDIWIVSFHETPCQLRRQ